MLKERTAEIQSQLDSDKAWWEKKRAGIQSDFMKELEIDAQAAEPEKKPVGEKKGGGSDDDAVLVDADGPAQDQGQGGGAKKRKGKK